MSTPRLPTNSDDQYTEAVTSPNTAIIHDWLLTYAGAEQVLAQMVGLYPQAQLYALVAAQTTRQQGLPRHKPVITSFIQKLPKATSHYRYYFPLFPLAIEQLDVSGYELVLSSSHCAAKGVLTGPDQLHICYCHSPARYAWDLQHQYLQDAQLTRGIKSWLVRYGLHRFRQWDYRTAAGVDYFIANSHYIARRIKKVYGRAAQVIYPNVAVDTFTVREQKDPFYLAASRMVPYKKLDVIVQAFAAMPDKTLVVIGDGPQYRQIKALATPNVHILGYQPQAVLQDYLARAQALVFAAEEDFGILPVEAQACGTPVLAFGKGGALETVVAGKTGAFFAQQTPEAIKTAVLAFEQVQHTYEPAVLRAHAEQFATARFQQAFSAYVAEKWALFKRGLS